MTAFLPPVVRSQFGGGGMAGGGALFAGGGAHGGSDPNLHLHLHQHMGPGALPAADPSLAGLHAGGLAFPPDLSGHPQQQHHYQQPPLMQQFAHPLAPYASECGTACCVASQDCCRAADQVSVGMVAPTAWQYGACDAVVVAAWRT